MVVFTPKACRNCKVRLFIEDPVYHTGAGSMGSHLKEDTDTVLISLLYQCCEVKTGNGLIEN